MQTLERQTTEISFLQSESSLPSEILELATREEPKPLYVCASDYAEAVIILRDEKNYTWKEVVEWFARVGMPFSFGSLAKVYRQAKRQ